MRCLVLAIALCACGHAATNLEPPARAGGGSGTQAVAAPADRVVALAGAANALCWDAATSTLYLTDSNADSLLRWTDAGGLDTVGALPAGSAGISLGGIVKRGDGTVLVASFGFGTQGTVFAMAGDATATALTGLDPARRRIGLAQDPDGALYSTYFVGGRDRAAGGVASLTIAGTTATETEIAGPFKKLVGLVATPTALYVSDQTQKVIFRISVPGFAVSQLAIVPKVDLLAILPDGDLLTGGGPTISRISPNGSVTTLPAPSFEQVHGLAYDPAGKRLFVVDHSATVGVPDKLHILALAD